MPQLDIGLDLLYTHNNTAYQGAAVVAANERTACDLPDRRHGRVVGVLPLAA